MSRTTSWWDRAHDIGKVVDDKPYNELMRLDAHRSEVVDDESMSRWGRTHNVGEVIDDEPYDELKVEVVTE
jgi:hypothetical protein